MDKIRPGVIFGIGNILLDISANVDYEYLKKWDLKLTDAILADSKHKDLPNDLIKSFPVIYLPGGSCQNTMRIAQWVLKKCPKACVMMGCISNDSFGKCMKEKAEEDDLECKFLIDTTMSTGICSVLITDSGKNRSMVADLGAANHFKKDFLVKNWNLIENSRICYSTGFHLTVCYEGILEIAKYCSNSNDKLFGFNISAPFICEKFTKEIDSVFKYADLIFGTDFEAQIYSDLKQWKTKDQIEIIKLIANGPRANKNKRKIIMMMKGLESVLIAIIFTEDEQFKTNQKFKIFNYEFLEIKKDEIIDLNGIGDAYTGGFLGKLIMNDLDLSEKSINECIRIACYATKEIVKQHGVTIPKHDIDFI